MESRWKRDGVRENDDLNDFLAKKNFKLPQADSMPKKHKKETNNVHAHKCVIICKLLASSNNAATIRLVS